MLLLKRNFPLSRSKGVAAQENMIYTFKSDTSKVKFSCTFTNGDLQILHVLEREGTPTLTKSVTNARDMAKDFLNNYQYLTGNPFYGKLSSTLINVDDTKNSTTTFGNMKLQVNASDNSKTYTWSYTFNGINAACKCVSLM